MNDKARTTTRFALLVGFIAGVPGVVIAHYLGDHLAWLALTGALVIGTIVATGYAYLSSLR